MKRRRLPRKKLVLTRESLVRLSDRRLAEARGGAPSEAATECVSCRHGDRLCTR